MQLTEAGKVLLERARQVLADVEAAEDAVRHAALGESGLVSLGFTSSSAYRVLPRIVSACRKAFPSISFGFRELTSAEQWQSLRMGKLDVALLRMANRVPDTGFDAFEVDREEMLLALPHGHPLVHSPSVPVRALDKLPMVGFSAVGSTYFRELSQRVFLAAGVQPHIVQESVLPTLLALVEAGLGAALVPASAAEMRSSRVSYRPLRYPGRKRNRTDDAVPHCAWPRANDNLAATSFIELLRTMTRCRDC